jgi:tRNA G18 (ribose-2'-O)-methylase SpoU
MFSAFRPRSIVGDMILVSSLLEKLPNIAHLTRTSEIFGVRELVVPNRKILEDEQYLAVSVTAERHIPILEVREDQLAQFLLLKKS